MPYDIKTFQQIRESVQKLEEIAKAIQALVNDAPPGLTNERDDLEHIRRQLENLAARVIQRAMAGVVE